MNVDLTVKHKTIKLVEEIKRENLHDFGFEGQFLGSTLKV